MILIMDCQLIGNIHRLGEKKEGRGLVHPSPRLLNDSHGLVAVGDACCVACILLDEYGSFDVLML